MKKSIVLLPGDGIGPEVTRAAAAILRESAQEFNHQFEFAEFLIGGAAIDAAGTPLPKETLDGCRKADGSISGSGRRAEVGCAARREASGERTARSAKRAGGCMVNVRPVKLLEPLRGISPLKADRLGELDLEIVRELAGGMYFGERGHTTEKGVERAWDTESYSTPEIERIATFAYARAENRSRRRLCSVDKANVLNSSQLWRRTVTAMSAVYPAVNETRAPLYVDNAAMQLTLRPGAI